MLLREIKIIFHKELDAKYPKEEVDSFFYLLVDAFLGLERFILAIEPEYNVAKNKEAPLFSGLSDLKLEKPIQYIIGKTHFYDLEFQVNKSVLIPRPETEELVDWIVSEYKNTNSELRILDIGTGSGCIAISLAKNLPNAKVFALDVSINALAVAKQNAKVNEVNIEFIEADILDVDSLDCKFDVIVSNPPYVRELEKKEMSKNVLEEEPGLALFVSDENPLVFYKSIAKFSKGNLKENGTLYFEINQYLGRETKNLIENIGFKEIELRKDMYGKNRMLKGKLD
ncbi:MAG: peptide chain release factor N(5)-glutamine methyltransferase [Cellulophaga sp.]